MYFFNFNILMKFISGFLFIKRKNRKKCRRMCVMSDITTVIPLPKLNISEYIFLCVIWNFL